MHRLVDGLAQCGRGNAPGQREQCAHHQDHGAIRAVRLLRKDRWLDQGEALGLATTLKLLSHLRLHLLVAQFAKPRPRTVEIARQLEVLALDLG